MSAPISEKASASKYISPKISLLEQIEETINKINSGKKEEADCLEVFENLNFLINRIHSGIPLPKIERTFNALIALIPFLNSEQISDIQSCGITAINLFPSLANIQISVSLALAKWYRKHRTSSLDQRCFDSMHFYGKAISIATTSQDPLLKDIHYIASKHIRKLVVELNQIKEKLTDAKGNDNLKNFDHVFKQILQLESIYLDTDGQKIIKKLYEQARDTLNQGNVNSRKRFYLAPVGDQIKRGLSKEIIIKDSPPPTYVYRKKIQLFRETFKLEYEKLAQTNPNYFDVYEFQTKINSLFKTKFFELLLKDVFMILGLPINGYDIRAMGSIGRSEMCPYSDLEWWILYENEKDRDYFQKLAKIFLLSIDSMDEKGNGILLSSATNIKGFHIDPPTRELIETVQESHRRQHNEDEIEPQSISYTMLHSSSLISDTPDLFNDYQLRLKKLVDTPLNEKSKTISTLRHQRALKLIQVRIFDYLKLDFSFEPGNVIDVKDQFTAPLSYLLNDLSFYYGIEETNPIEIIKKLVEKKFFTKSSGELIKQAVANIYLLRLRLHFAYKRRYEKASVSSSYDTSRNEPSTSKASSIPLPLETLVKLSLDECSQLKKTYWLVIRPLYHKLEHYFHFSIRCDLVKRLKNDLKTKPGENSYRKIRKAQKELNKLKENIENGKNPKLSLEIYENLIKNFKNFFGEIKEINSFEDLKKNLKDFEKLKRTLIDLSKETELEKRKNESLEKFGQEPLNLINIAFTQEISKKKNNLRHILSHLIDHLLKTKAPLSRHIQFYEILSKQIIFESHRKTYLKILDEQMHIQGVKEIFDSLLLIPNTCGLRYLSLKNEKQLYQSLEGITTSSEPKNFSFTVIISSHFFNEKRYLKPEIIKQVIDEKTLNLGHIKKEYKSFHNVAHGVFDEHDLHFKEKPTQALMEYAIHNLVSRIAGELTPSTVLTRFDVCLNGKPLCSYPVLISSTIEGVSLDQAIQENRQLDKKTFTLMLLCAILTKPGDGRFPNYVVNILGQIFCIDNDISFIESIIYENSSYSVKFRSALFCLNTHIPLDKKVLEEFISLNPILILNEWIDDVIKMEEQYCSPNLFSKDKIKELYEEDPDNRFKTTILFKSGALITLLMQFIDLQKYIYIALEEDSNIYPLDLLKTLISVDIKNKNKQMTVGEYIYKKYSDSFSETYLSERLKEATSIGGEVSLTSAQSDRACLDCIPTIEDVESREEFGPHKAKEELLAVELSNVGFTGVLKKTDKGNTLEANFKKIQKNGNPDLNRQERILQVLLTLLKNETEKPEVISITHCAILKAEHLEILLHEKVKHLDLRHCKEIDNKAVLIIEKNCPHLEELFLSGCVKIKDFSHASFLNTDPLVFSKLEIFHIGGCPFLKTLHIKVPSLKELKANKNPRLKTPILENFKPQILSTIINFDDSPKIDLAKFFVACMKSFEINFSRLKRSEKFIKNIVTILYLHGGKPSDWNQHKLIGLLLLLNALEALSKKTQDLILSNKNLELDLENLSKEEWNILSQLFAERPNLNHLTTISLKNLERKEFLNIVPTIHQTTSLTSLDLSKSIIKGIDIDVLSSLLRQMHSLKSLNLEGNLIGPSIGENILYTGMNSLTSLNLKNNHIGDKGAEVLAPNLKIMSSLDSLNLSENIIGVKGIEFLTPVFILTKFLTHLDLESNYLGEKGTCVLTPALKKMTSLTSLNLGNNCIRENGVIALKPALLGMSLLTSLYLHQNDINAMGLYSLSSILVTMTSLRSLNLAKNDFNEIGAPFLTPVFKKLPLEYINLSDNQLGNNGINEIIPGIAEWQVALTLDLSMNGISETGIETLLPLLNSLNTLSTKTPPFPEIILSDNNIPKSLSETILSKFKYITIKF